MKLMLGGTPVKKMMIHNDTMDATMVASDMQAGVTAYANGQKVTGTGKSFEFASYGNLYLNFPIPVTSEINVIEVASFQYPVILTMELNNMKSVDFSTPQTIAKVIINSVEYPVSVVVASNMMTISCEQNISLEVFYGRDLYA